MQSELWWWFLGATPIAAPGWWFAWRAHLNRELASFREVTVIEATYYASRHVGPGAMEAVGRQLRFTRRPPRPTLRGFSRRRLRRALDRGQRRPGFRRRRVQYYLVVKVLPQQPGLLAVTVEPAAGFSAWHALEEMARTKAWSLESGGPPPTWFEPSLDGTSIPYYVFPDDDVLVYIFADPGWFTRMWLRVTAFGRWLRRVAGRVSAAASAAVRIANRRFRRTLRGSRRGGNKGRSDPGA